LVIQSGFLFTQINLHNVLSLIYCGGWQSALHWLVEFANHSIINAFDHICLHCGRISVRWVRNFIRNCNMPNNWWLTSMILVYFSCLFSKFFLSIVYYQICSEINMIDRLLLLSDVCVNMEYDYVLCACDLAIWLLKLVKMEDKCGGKRIYMLCWLICIISAMKFLKLFINFHVVN
jgi:hypothetical protein